MFDKKSKTLFNAKITVQTLFMIFFATSCCQKKNIVKNNRPVLTVAGVVHVCPQGKIALIERGKTPFGIAMFGGHVENESPEAAFLREIKEELNITSVKNMHLIGVHGNLGRDPRQHSVEITYSVTTNQNPVAGDDAKSVKLYSNEEIIKMIQDKKFAFDHGEILSKYLEKIGKCNPCKAVCKSPFK